ncbi:stonustoxin subunit beta-like [Halichoeres trimaculatus]|uniref:stonustoxin subunit beta-like n=1 Tax=Halichoeres trimaculatus TaxID=147232 RepID=UPI003D9ED8A8
MLSDIVGLTTLCLDHCGEHRLKPGIKKYDGSLKLDENTASRRLFLSDDKKRVKTVQRVEERVQREENEDRFKRTQVSCEEGQKGLCYWEVEWKGTVGIAVAYRGVDRKWDSKSGLGCNDMSWSLLCSKNGYKAIHGKTSEDITEPFSQKIAVLLDWEAGTLSYYCDKSGELSLIHTFKAQFTEPVYPGFWFKKGSVTLCEVDKTPHRWSEVKAQTLNAEKGEEKPKVKKSVKTQKKKVDLSQVPWRS